MNEQIRPGNIGRKKMNKNKPEVEQRGAVFETPWFQVISKTVTGLNRATEPEEFYVVKPDDYVSVIAVTPSNQIVLVRQYRPAVEDYTLELPSGHVHARESPLAAAQRELLEETGYRCEKVELLGCLSPDTGRLGNRLWCYFAPDVALVEGVRPASEEGIEVIICSLSELAEHIIEGRLNHALNMAAIMLAVAKGRLPPLLVRAGRVYPEFRGEKSL